MKIIKLIPAFTICLCSAGLLQAQEVKTDIAKPLEIKTSAGAGDKTSQQSTFKPQPQVAASTTNSPATAAETPSPLTRKEAAKPQGQERLEAKVLDEKNIATPGGEEGRKIMAGNSSRPKDPIYSPSTADTKPAPPVTKPAAGNQQQQ